jgi:hypothetical protein
MIPVDAPIAVAVFSYKTEVVGMDVVGALEMVGD